MENLSGDILEGFLKGNHVLCYNPGLWNGIWSDMFIETTFMRYGHEAGGIVGITLQPAIVTRWALSLHISSQLRNALAMLKDRHKCSNGTSHKKESKARIADRDKLNTTLTNYIDPLNSASHPPGIRNVVTGLIVSGDVNVDNSVTI